MAKFKFNLNDIHLYEWGDLYWFEYEMSLELWALRNLISYQEEIYQLKQEEFIAKRNVVLPTIPDEHRDAYEQNFFEDADRTFQELKRIQRNSICLSFFSFIEGKLQELISMMEKEFNTPYKRVRMEILASFNRYIVNDCNVDGASFKKSYKRIFNQNIVRNSIAHNQSYIQNATRFKKEEGVVLKGTKIVIEDVVYLNNLISWSEDYFKELFIAVDLRLTKIKSAS